MAYLAMMYDALEDAHREAIMQARRHHANLRNRKMDAMDIQAVESKLSDVTVTAIPMGKNIHKEANHSGNSHATISTVPTAAPSPALKDKDNGVTKYAQLLAVIEEMGKEVRPSYSGSRSSAERLKRGIVHARILVRECLIETERSARQ